MSTPAANRSRSPKPGEGDKRSIRRLILFVFGPIAVVVLVIGLALTRWAGYFDAVQFEQRQAGPYALLYREYQGPSAGIRMAVRDVFLYYRKRVGRVPRQGFTRYAVDTTVSPSDSLHALVGCLTDTLLDSLEPPYQARAVAACPALVATFPLRSPFSYMVGFFKYRDALPGYLAETEVLLRDTTMELYDLETREIRYIVPLAQFGEENAPDTSVSPDSIAP